jgi:hypothetical protein
MSDLERLYTPVPVEVRSGRDGKRTIGGYAAVFMKLSENLGGFVERVAPSTFNKSRGDGWPNVFARYNHDPNMLLGTSDSGTLRLTVDDTGLLYEVDAPNSRDDVYELVERGDVRKSSFAFRSAQVEDEWGVSDQGYPQRTLLSAPLVDVAPVGGNQPAYPDSTAGLRSLAAHFGADLDEVRRLAEANELRRFFVRTDGKPKGPTFGPAARAELLGKGAPPAA